MPTNPEPGGGRLTGLLITGIVVIFSDMISSIFPEEGVESRLRLCPMNAVVISVFMG